MLLSHASINHVSTFSSLVCNQKSIVFVALQYKLITMQKLIFSGDNGLMLIRQVID